MYTCALFTNKGFATVDSHIIKLVDLFMLFRHIVEPKIKRKKKDSPGEFFLGVHDFWFRPIQYFRPVSYSCPHTRVHVSFGAFNVVVEIVTEILEKRNRLISHSWGGKMSGGKDYDQDTNIKRNLVISVTLYMLCNGENGKYVYRM